MQKNRSFRRLIALFSAFTIAATLVSMPAVANAASNQIPEAVIEEEVLASEGQGSDQEQIVPTQTEGSDQEQAAPTQSEGAKEESAAPQQPEEVSAAPAPVTIEETEIPLSSIPEAAGMLRAPLASPAALPLSDPNPVTVLNGEMVDVELTGLTINNETNAYLYRYDSAVMNITWEWDGASQYLQLGDGAYFEIELPSQFVYEGFSRTEADADGNEILFECVARETDGVFVLRTTYRNVNGVFNQTSGDVRVTFRPRADLAINGTLTTDVTVKVTNGVQDAATLTTQVTIDESARALAGNEWVVRYKEYWEGNTGHFQTTDFVTNVEEFYINHPMNNARLYVVANHYDDLVKDPFHDRNTDIYGKYVDDNVVDYEPNVSNYLDAYCADIDNHNAPSGRYLRGTLQPDTPYQVGDKKLTAWQVDRLIMLLSISYPFVSLKEMHAALDDPIYNGVPDFPMFDEATAVAAVQAAVWTIIHDFPYNGEDFYNGKSTQITDVGGRSSYAAVIQNALVEYAKFAPVTPQEVVGSDDFTTYEFAETPVLKLSGDTAEVSGRITPVTNVDRLTGTFSSGTKEVTFTVEEDGTFTAVLDGVSRHDTFDIKINGKVPGKTSVFYFTSQEENDKGFHQNLISCIREERDVELHWEFQGFFERLVRIVKVDGAYPDETLYGAEFTLYETMDGVVTPDMEPFGVYETNLFGEARIRGLIDGAVYVLIETRAPERYELPDPVVPIVFHIEEVNGVPQIVIDSAAPADLMNGGVELIDNETMGIRVKNQAKAYVLPETGGVGRMPFAVTGSVMMAFSAALLFERRRRDGKRGERA